MNISRRSFVAACSPLVLKAQNRPPNVIFILADDLGWGDLACYGNKQIKTPNLDRLARQGTMFTQFYVANPVCSPSRTAFMTGQYPARNRIHGHLAQPEMNTQRGMPHWLDPSIVFLPRQLQQHGYATAHFGKWHLGGGEGAPQPAAYGIDKYRIFVGNGPQFPREKDHWAHLTARVADETIAFIEQNREKPFYVNMWTNLVHAPLDPTDEQMAPYKQFSPGANLKTNNRFFGQMEVYFGSVTELDSQAGRVLKRLDETGLAENTIVIFSSDNGPEDPHLAETAHSGIGSPGPFRGRKRSLYEGGVRVPYIVRWPGHVPAGRVDSQSVLSGVDFLPTMAQLTGASIPSSWRLDGEDTSDILLGKSRPRHRPLLWEWRFRILGDAMHKSPMLSIRDGNWKLLLNPDNSRLELYDIPKDPYESDNLAERRPEIVGRLKDMALSWQKTLPLGPVDKDSGKRDYPWPAGNQEN